MWQQGGLEKGQLRAHIWGMTETSPELINGRRIVGRPWGWLVDLERIRLAKFPGKPLITFRKFDTLELAREAALRLGPIQEIDESEYDPSKTP